VETRGTADPTGDSGRPPDGRGKDAKNLLIDTAARRHPRKRPAGRL